MDKQEVLRITLEYLKQWTHIQVINIIGHFEKLLQAQGKAGVVTTGSQLCRTTTTIPFPGDIKLLINEVIWDLIVERVVTPGMDGDNLEWPFLRVTDMEKLESKLKELQ